MQLEDRIMLEVEKNNKLINEIAVIVRNHDVYISDVKRWRITIVGLSFTMFLQVCGGLYFAGQLTERLDHVYKLSVRNENRLDKYDEKIIRERRDNN